jgi:hypothetical protein
LAVVAQLDRGFHLDYYRSRRLWRVFVQKIRFLKEAFHPTGNQPKNIYGGDIPHMADKPGKIEHFEKQFGIVAVEKGYITADNLIEALKTQVEEEIKDKNHRLIGEILMEKDYITANEIDDVLNSMFVR